METGLMITLGDEYNDARATHDRANWQHRLVLVPDSRKVEVWSGYGNGVPMPLWHGTAISLGRIPDGTADTEPYREALRGCEALLLELAGLHGTRWDGSNTVGYYTDRGRADEVQQEISLALGSVEAPTFWEAGDWFHGADLFPAGFDGESFTTLAAEFVGQAALDGAYLNDGNVEKYLRREWGEASE